MDGLVAFMFLAHCVALVLVAASLVRLAHAIELLRPPGDRRPVDDEHDADWWKRGGGGP